MNLNDPKLAGADRRAAGWGSPLKLALIYALVACLWIILSDRLLLWLPLGPEERTWLQTFKGWFFVAATALLLAWLARRDLAAVQAEVHSCQAVQESFRALVETIPHGIQESDCSGTITFTNAGYDRIFGLEPGAAIGSKIWDKEPSEEGRRYLEAYLQELVAEQPEPVPYVARNRTADGRVIDVQVDWDYLRDDAGELVGFASVLTDITNRRKADEAIRASDRLKTELISTAAHEFRTPLTTIQGFSELLLGPVNYTDGERREFIGNIHTKAVALGDMVENLLNLSRIEAGRSIPICYIDCSIAELAADVAPLLKALRTRHPIETDFADASIRIYADRGRINQVIENLLSNADKYSAAGSPIRLSGRADGERYRVEVSDEGVGLAAEELPRVWERFYRVVNSNTGPSGLGIGLAIVKHIVEAHGGTVQIQSIPGQGTAVSFDLPIQSSVK